MPTPPWAKRRAPRRGSPTRAEPEGRGPAGAFSVSTDLRAAPVPGERRRGVAPLACVTVRGALRERAVSTLGGRETLNSFRGRPRASPEPTVLWVTGLLSPAVRSHRWSEVPRRTARSVRL